MLPIKEHKTSLVDLKGQLVMASGVPGSFVHVVEDEKLKKVLGTSKVKVITHTSGEAKFSRMLLIGDTLILGERDVKVTLETIYELE